MHELYLVKVSETLDFITYIAPITIMTRSPLLCQGYDTNNSLYLNDILYSNITSYLSGHY